MPVAAMLSSRNIASGTESTVPLGNFAKGSIQAVPFDPVARGETAGVCLAVIPGNAELDLKALARPTGDRRMEVVPLQGSGAFDRLGTRRRDRARLPEGVSGVAGRVREQYDRIPAPAGAHGIQLLLSPFDYVRATGAQHAAIRDQ